MKVLAIHTSPNLDGLTALMAQAALKGAESAGADTELIPLKQVEILACRQCRDGWGPCLAEGDCVIEDDFHQVRAKIAQADAIILASPTYFGDISEVAKNFLDRLRRTAMRPEGPHTAGVFVLSIAAPGGSGGGGPTTLMALEGYYGVCQMPTFDEMIVTQRSRKYMLETAEKAGAAMVQHIGEQAKGSE